MSDRLKNFVERIEDREEAKREISETIKEVYGELKSEGFDKKVVRKIIRDRKKARAVVLEERELQETYEAALGLR